MRVDTVFLNGGHHCKKGDIMRVEMIIIKKETSCELKLVFLVVVTIEKRRHHAC